METYIVDWLNMLARWLHFVAGVAWIGASFYFVMLDNSLKPPKKSDEAKRGVFGELWAVHGGGFAAARAIVNLHVGKNDACADPPAMLTDYARRAGVPEPFVGLLTGAWTELAALGEEDGAGIPALAVATVGLSNRIAAGRAPVEEQAADGASEVFVVEPVRVRGLRLEQMGRGERRWGIAELRLDTLPEVGTVTAPGPR